MAKKKAGNSLVGAIVTIIIIAIFSIPATLWYVTHPMGDGTAPVYFRIKDGETLYSVANRLAGKELIRFPHVFVKITQVLGDDRRIVSGYYQLNRGMDAFEIIKVIKNGNVVMEKFTVPPGRNLFEVADILHEKGLASREDFLRACVDKVLLKELGIPNRTAEGYLFPDTYYIARDHSASKIVETMAGLFFKRFPRETLTKRANELGLTLNELVTLASIVEKESSVRAERSLIAGVFYNRIARGMKFQTDPTVLYAKTIAAGQSLSKTHPKRHLNTTIYQSDLNRDNPYNTYRYEGFPPGPISTISSNSMYATLFPSTNEGYLFFCADGSGGHAFSRTGAGHSANVKRWREIERGMREGN